MSHNFKIQRICAVQKVLKVKKAVIPAKAGIQYQRGIPWIPAFAGMTGGGLFARLSFLMASRKVVGRAFLPDQVGGRAAVLNVRQRRLTHNDKDGLFARLSFLIRNGTLLDSIRVIASRERV